MHVPAARANARLRTAVLVAVAMSAFYVIALLLEITRPEYQGPEPALGLLDDSPSLRLQLTLLLVGVWISLAAWGLTDLLSRGAADEPSRYRWLAVGKVVALGALVLPYVVTTLQDFPGNDEWLFVCLLSTGLALLLVTRLQRFDRMGWRIPVCAFGWGAFVGPGFIRGIATLFKDFYPAFSFGGDVSIAAVDAWQNHIFLVRTATFGFGEELGKSAGILLLCALFRHKLTGVVSGIVVGAAVGLGFNFSESLLYLSTSPAAEDLFQLWSRQGVSLLAAHLAFSATVGAGVGLAMQLSSRRQQAAAIGSGVALASCCHFATNLTLTYLSESRGVWLPGGQEIYSLLLFPLLILIMHSPLTVLYLLMARAGSKAQAHGLTTELSKEAATGYGAVIPTEVPVLLSPRRRFRRKLLELRRHGLGAYRRLDRLYAAQLRMGTHRWLASTGDQEASTTDLADLRERALRCKLLSLEGLPTLQPDSARAGVLAGASR